MDFGPSSSSYPQDRQIDPPSHDKQTQAQQPSLASFDGDIIDWMRRDKRVVIGLQLTLDKFLESLEYLTQLTY